MSRRILYFCSQLSTPHEAVRVLRYVRTAVPGCPVSGLEVAVGAGLGLRTLVELPKQCATVGQSPSMTHAVELPIPRDWQVFEDFCRDLFAAEWGDPETEKHGRPGQADHGVDVFGQRNGKWAAVQCKRRRQFPEVKLSKAEIRAEVASAQGFELPLDLLVIATTAPVDAPLQTFAAGLRKNDSDPRVIVSGWQALVERLQDHPEIFENWRQKLGAYGPHPLHLPFRPLGDLLKGRETELATLAAGLDDTASGAFAVTQQRLETVHGLGGVGKTALAVEHAWRCRERYSGVFFVRAESPELLLAGLAELAPVMELAASRDEAAVVAGVLRWLQHTPGWLLILDNVDDEAAATAVMALLPRLSTGRVLITSRLSNWSGDVAEVALDVLEVGKAVDLLRDRAAKRILTGDDLEQAESLAEELGRLPLALEQAAAYISVHRGTFADYRAQLTRDTAKVTAWYDPRLMRYPRSIALTWQPSFDRLGPSARTMLHLVAFLAPDGIPRFLFAGEAVEKVLVAAVAEFDLSEAVRELSEYSFLQTTDEGYSVHRMVQEVVRSRLDPASRKEWAGRAVDLLNTAEPGDPQDARHWPAWRVHRPHAERGIRHAWAEGFHQPNLSVLMNQTGVYLLQLALHADAEPLYRRALLIDEASYGEEHPRVAIELNNLAQLLQATNRLSEAEPLMRRALLIDEASYGEEHPRVAIELNNLAQLLQATNRLSEAEPLMRRALLIDEASYGEEHPRVAIELNNLAQLLQATNRLSEAEPLMRRALLIDEASYGEEHPRVAIELNNLAQLLQATNRLSEAEPLMRRALLIDEASYGEEHPRVAIELNNLAQLLQATNRLSEAEPLMRRALLIDEASYGEEHPRVAIELNNLAQLLQATNRLSEAEPLMRRALLIDEASYGEEHPRVAIELNNLAQLLQATNRLSEAEPLMRRALLIDEASYGEEHPRVAIELNNLAQLLQATNRLSEAEPLMRRALLIDEASYGEEHPEVAIDLNNLARLLQDLDRLDEAIQLMERAVAILEASLVEGHPWREGARANLAAMLATRGEAEGK